MNAVKIDDSKLLKSTIIFFTFLLATMFVACGNDNDNKTEPGPVAVSKTNSTVVYMHYMPWFQSKPVSNYWGSHWKMSNKNPDVVDGNGKREIASHYYPLIGPYDSKDPDVVEYHLLLMKYSGVDAVLIDWYGSHNVNDYRSNLIGSNALIDALDDVGLKFAIVYEDYAAGIVGDKTSKTAEEAAQADMAYMRDNYFSKPEYFKIDDQPLLLTFGPRYFKVGPQWTSIFSVLPTKPKFLPLWGHTAFTGDTDDGEYGWIDFNESLSVLNNLYDKIPTANVIIGSAYPRFHDFYAEGGQGTSYGYVADNNGQTLVKTLAKATERKAKHVQLATWNDFGEGTVIEPTLEFGYQSLQTIQQFTGVQYDVNNLELIHEYYLKKTKYKTDDAASAKLKEAFIHLTRLEVDQAKEIIDSLE